MRNAARETCGGIDEKPSTAWRISRHGDASCLFQVTLEERISRFNRRRSD